MPAGAIKVDRSTPWGNPFVVGEDGTAAECVQLYRMLLAGHICLSARADVFEQKRRMVFAVENIERLQGADLACWCKPSKPCHADVLIEFAEQRMCPSEAEGSQ